MSMQPSTTPAGELSAASGRKGLMWDLFGDRDPFKEFSEEPFQDEGYPNLRYSTQRFVQSSVLGGDGQVHTERFASSDVGDRQQGVRETQQAYSNSSSGARRMARERHSGGRAIKATTARSGSGQEEHSEEMFRGIAEGDREAFEQEFATKAQQLPALPQESGSWLALGAPARGS